MGLCSGDDLGRAMSEHYAAQSGRDAQKENVKLRHEIEQLKLRLDKIEARLPNGP